MSCHFYQPLSYYLISFYILISSSNGFPITERHVIGGGCPHHYQPPPPPVSLFLNNNHGRLQPLFLERSHDETVEDSSVKDAKKEDYEQRRQLWLERYGSLEALQSTFGTGGRNTTFKGKGGSGSLVGGVSNIFHGDLTPQQTRRLYHTLLPRSLLGMYDMGLMKPEELAPLAFEARMAAKEYARSRCVWYGRLGTVIFDQYRNLRDRRQLRRKSGSSMTWDEIWSKYEAQIVQEECAAELKETTHEEGEEEGKTKRKPKKPLNHDDLTMRIYSRILEKSCATNEAFDKMFLKKPAKSSAKNDSTDVLLDQMGQQLDEDVRTILLLPKDSKKVEKKVAKLEEEKVKEKHKLEKKQAKELEKEGKELEKELEKEEKRQLKMEKKRLKLQKEDTTSSSIVSTNATNHEDSIPDSNPDKKHRKSELSRRWQALRVLAGTRRKFRKLHHREKRKGTS